MLTVGAATTEDRDAAAPQAGGRGVRGPRVRPPTAAAPQAGVRVLRYPRFSTDTVESYAMFAGSLGEVGASPVPDSTTAGAPASVPSAAVVADTGLAAP